MVRCGNIGVGSSAISERLVSQIFHTVGDVLLVIPRFNNAHQGAAILKKSQKNFSMAVQWLDNINCNIYFNVRRLLLLFQYGFQFSMFRAISSSCVSDFYWVWLNVCVAIDGKSENVTVEQSTCALRIDYSRFYICSDTQIYNYDTNSGIFKQT